MARIHLLLLLFFCLGCNEHKQNSVYLKDFKTPYIVTSKKSDTIKYFEAYNVSSRFPPFIRKYKFSDTIILSRKISKADSLYGKDLYFGHWYNVCGDTVRSDGLEIVADYRNKVNYSEWGERQHYYYPVFIINETHGNKLLVAKDSYCFGLQEALDSNDDWHPIETRGFDFCGNGYYGLKIHPGEFGLCLFPVYKGTYKTKLRVRMLIGGDIYISNTFDGTINYSQFHCDTASFQYHKLLESPVYNVLNGYYGAIPLDIKEERISWHAVYTN